MYDFASDQQIPHIQKAIQYGRKAISIREQFLSEYRDETKDQTTDCSFKETDDQRRDNEKEKGDDFNASTAFSPVAEGQSISGRFEGDDTHDLIYQRHRLGLSRMNLAFNLDSWNGGC